MPVFAVCRKLFCMCVLYLYLHVSLAILVLFFYFFPFKHSPGNAESEHFQNTWASTGVKIGSAWFCFLVYLWTLIAPLVLGSCRDFDYADD